MGDMVDTWRVLRSARQEKRQRALATADPTGWIQHTTHHWSRELAGKRLDYWPSTRKFQYEGVVMQGDVKAFIEEKEDGISTKTHTSV